jgi:hypothetical protein
VCQDFNSTENLTSHTSFHLTKIIYIHRTFSAVVQEEEEEEEED